MVAESRTAKSLRNAKVALLFYFLNLVLQFFSRRIFLDYLGSEVLGLNTTAQNLLGFLNLAELGVGSAVAYNLYKPLYDKDINAVNASINAFLSFIDYPLYLLLFKNSIYIYIIRIIPVNDIRNLLLLPAHIRSLSKAQKNCTFHQSGIFVQSMISL